MERLEYLLSIVQFATDTKEKRHIVGGMLVSISLLFGGMAFTVMTTGGVTNVMTNPYFVPKTAMDYDYIFTMFWENGWQAGVKRVTVKNTQIIGHAQNDSAPFKTNSALELNQRYFVLRRVYGV